MKLLWQKYRDLPPKKLLCLWLAALLAVTLLLLHILRRPEDRFRRQEAADFLGPMEILGQIETDAPVYDRAVIAADEHTAAVFLYNDTHDLFLSREREGAFTLLTAGYLSSVSWYTEEAETLTLPLILFDRHPKAVRAELEIDAGEMHWTLESVRDGSGWFRFDLIRSPEPEEPEIRALARLYEMVFRGGSADISLTARFYGAAGDLIAEEQQ